MLSDLIKEFESIELRRVNFKNQIGLRVEKILKDHLREQLIVDEGIILYVADNQVFVKSVTGDYRPTLSQLSFYVTHFPEFEEWLLSHE